ncbi:hypothetical protein BHQ15_16790 [Mycolicibacillus koreensis]|nr:hypothetical protein BHQ15_16790 [Mycolicibacillus koreensis]
MDFGALPPEINASRIYLGPGSGPMLAASSAWHGLASELSSAAAKYQAEVAGLANSWKGVAGQRMAAAAAPHIQWLSTTAAQAEQAGAQAAAQAVAYETARAATTPPPVIAANRSTQASLVATNFLGQNTGAIMATEALYMEMWAQCAAAMYGYAAATEQSSALPQPTPARQNTDPSGAGRQAAALTQTAATDATGKGGDIALKTGATNGITDPIKDALKDPLGTLTDMYNGYKPTDALNDTLEPPYRLAGIISSSAGFLKTVAPATSAASKGITGANGMMLTPVTATVGNALGNALGGTPASAPIAANLASATRLGGLSVPASWAGAAPAVNAAANTLPAANMASSIGSGTTGAGHMLGGVPLSGAGAAARGIGDGVLRVGPRAFVMPRPLSAG